MSQVKIKDNESLENALRRFKRQTQRDGVIQEVRKREHYEKPSVKRKKKLYRTTIIQTSHSFLRLKSSVGCECRLLNLRRSIDRMMKLS